MIESAEVRLRPATTGELCLAIYHFEKEGLPIVGHAPKSETLAIEHPSSDEAVGIIQLYTGHAYPGTVGFATMIFDKEKRGSKVMKAAMTKLVLRWNEWSDALMETFAPILVRTHRLETIASFDNEAARHGLPKLGFVHEGTMRKWYPRRGGFVDAEIYALVKGAR